VTSTDRDDLLNSSAELVVYASRLVRSIGKEAGSRIPTATLRLLARLDESAPTTIGRLAELDRCAQPTMSRAVQSLVDKGWAERYANSDDARSSLVGITSEGRAALNDVRARAAVVVADRYQNLPNQDVRRLRAAVDVLRELTTGAHTHIESKPKVEAR